MWAELGIGGGALTLVGLGMRQLQTKLSCKQSKDFCDERHTHIKEDLTKGDVKFTKIMEDQVSIKEALTRIETKLEFIGPPNVKT